MDEEAARMAYDAGRALPRVTWSEEDDPPPVGERHCPFADGDPQKDHWLRGLRDSLAQQMSPEERANLILRIEDRLEVKDHVS